MSCRRVLALLAVLAGMATPATAQKIIISAKLEDLQAAAVKDSCDPAAHYNLAMGYWSKKHYSQADSALRRAIAIDAQFADAYLALSILHNWDQDYQDALKKQKGDSALKRWEHESASYYSKAFMLDPLVDIKILGATYKIYGGGRLLHALDNMVTGQYDKAYADLDKELAFWGGHAGADSAPPALLWFHALTAAHVGQFEPATRDLDILATLLGRVAAADSTPDVDLTVAQVKYMKASFLLRSGHPDDAMALFREVAGTDFGNYMIHVQMARIYESVRDYPKALAERTNALNINPEDASLMLDRGITLGKSGDMAQAETQLEQAEEANPRDTRILFWLGIAQAEQGKKDAARDSFNAFLSRAPSRFDRQIAMAHDRLAKL